MAFKSQQTTEIRIGVLCTTRAAGTQVTRRGQATLHQRKQKRCVAAPRLNLDFLREKNVYLVTRNVGTREGIKIGQLAKPRRRKCMF